MSPESPWNREKFNRVTRALQEAGLPEWPRMCLELNIRNGSPRFLVNRAHYDDPSKATASHYDFSSVPWHDEVRDVIVIENPFLVSLAVLNNQHVDPSFPVLGPFVEMDAETATKILVLGLP